MGVLCRENALSDIGIFPEKNRTVRTYFGLGSNICSPAEVTKPAPVGRMCFCRSRSLSWWGWSGPTSSQSSLSIVPELEQPCQALLGVWAEGAQLAAVPHSSQPSAMLPTRSLSPKCSYFVPGAFQSVELHTTLPHSTCSPRRRVMEKELQWMRWTGQCRSTWRRRVSGR